MLFAFGNKFFQNSGQSLKATGRLKASQKDGTTYAVINYIILHNKVFFPMNKIIQQFRLFLTVKSVKISGSFGQLLVFHHIEDYFCFLLTQINLFTTARGTITDNNFTEQHFKSYELSLEGVWFESIYLLSEKR